MAPRVAVRDKTPHRFQVVPLREISQRPTDGVNALALPNLPQTISRLDLALCGMRIVFTCS